MNDEGRYSEVEIRTDYLLISRSMCSHCANLLGYCTQFFHPETALALSCHVCTGDKTATFLRFVPVQLSDPDGIDLSRTALADFRVNFWV
jgi:hypothetical protein